MGHWNGSPIQHLYWLFCSDVLNWLCTSCTFGWDSHFVARIYGLSKLILTVLSACDSLLLLCLSLFGVCVCVWRGWGGWGGGGQGHTGRLNFWRVNFGGWCGRASQWITDLQFLVYAAGVIFGQNTEFIFSDTCDSQASWIISKCGGNKPLSEPNDG